MALAASANAQEKPIVFSRPDCPNCPGAKTLVETLSHEYTVIHDREGPVPRVSYRGKTVVGYNPKAIRELLGGTAPLPTAPLPTAPTVVRMAGPRWTWPGDIANHLVNGHGYSPEQLSGMSQEQLIALHDNAHNGARSTVQHSGQVMEFRSTAPKRYRVSLFRGGRFRIFGGGRSSGGGCPGGVCP